MKKKYMVGLCASIFIALQIWSSFITFHHPYIGIFLNLTSHQQWEIKELAPGGVGTKLDLQVGDIVKQVDGKLPDESLYVQKWRTIEQAHTLLITSRSKTMTFSHLA